MVIPLINSSHTIARLYVTMKRITIMHTLFPTSLGAKIIATANSMLKVDKSSPTLCGVLTRYFGNFIIDVLHVRWKTARWFYWRRRERRKWQREESLKPRVIQPRRKLPERVRAGKEISSLTWWMYRAPLFTSLQWSINTTRRKHEEKTLSVSIRVEGSKNKILFGVYISLARAQRERHISAFSLCKAFWSTRGTATRATERFSNRKTFPAWMKAD